MTKKTWWKLDHHLWSELKKYNLEKQRVLVAFSGGPDSLALAHSCVKVLGSERVRLAHFHHGGKSEYRDEASQFAKDWSEKNNVPILIGKRTSQHNPGFSEASMRRDRYEFLLTEANKLGISVVMTAHNSNDVLETRLMRLIRGTGPQGLKAIQVYRPPLFRPWLEISRGEIELYISKEKLKPLTDPSNIDTRYLRNWLRGIWLPELEAKRPGAGRVLAQSLDSIVATLSSQDFSFPLDKMHRGQFMALTQDEQRRWLAAALLHIGQKNFTKGHLDEIRRRVLESPKNNSFKVAGCNWQINAQQILVQLA
jgi:tRNA(Ile)-lysidine synthase